MDTYNFKTRPTKGDLVIRRSRMTAEKVEDYYADEEGEGFIKYAPYHEGGEVKVSPLGDEGIEEKLVLHIPLEEVAQRLRAVRTALRGMYPLHKASADLILWITEGNNSDPSTWDISWTKIPMSTPEKSPFLNFVSPQTTEEEIQLLAKEMLDTEQDSFEQI